MTQEAASTNITSRLSATIPAKTVLLAVFIVSVIAAKLRFWPWVPEVFYGDDLFCLLSFESGQFASTLGQAISSDFVEKYRPVFALALWALLGSFGDNLTPYMIFNLLLHGLNVTLAFALARRLSGNWFVALAVAVAIATSRFALFQVTFVSGVLEGLSLTFLLIALYSVLRAEAHPVAAWRWGWIAIIATFLALHTHERYLGLAPWLALALLLFPSFRQLPRKRLIILFGACIGVIVFNVIYKIAVLHMPFLVGTGGTHIGINTNLIWEHFLQLLLSTFTWNYGPEYLVGAPIAGLSKYVQLTSATFILAWLIGVGMALFSLFRNRSCDNSSWQPFALPFSLVVLAAVIAAPPILTIRIEQRWLLEPFILMLLFFAWAVGVNKHVSYRRAGMLLALVLGTTSIVVDTYIAPHFERVFFVSSGRFAAVAKRDIIDKNPGATSPVILIANNSHCNWSLLQGGLFRLYGGKDRSLQCVGSLSDIRVETLAPNTQIYGSSLAPLRLVNLTSDLRAQPQAGSEVVLYDFLGAFAEGQINSNVKVSSPNGQGVLLAPWDTLAGQRKTLTVIAGFSYRYDNLQIGSNAELQMALSMIYPSQFAARAIVQIRTEDGVSTANFMQDLVPPTAGEKLRFVPVTIPLTDFAGKKVSITFSAVTPPGGDGRGHWIGFAEPRVTQASRK